MAVVIAVAAFVTCILGLGLGALFTYSATRDISKTQEEPAMPRMDRGDFERFVAKTIFGEDVDRAWPTADIRAAAAKIGAEYEDQMLNEYQRGREDGWAEGVLRAGIISP